MVLSVCKVVEEFILDLSHSYLQQVWVKATNGTEEDRVAILSTVLHSVVTATTMFAIVCPFFR
jgi:isoleucyl-tRNA synthetase